MKAKYRPGKSTPQGLLNGPEYSVDVVEIKLAESRFINKPVLVEVKVKYKTGRTEWISGEQFFSSITNSRNIQRIVY
jgi:hypothetical protein